MARQSKKTILLSIMNEILIEYEKVRHRNDISNCGLCQQFINKNKLECCSACPMYVFKNDIQIYPCMARRCQPVDCRFLDPKDKDLKRVIRFYKKAIAKIESMSTQAVARSGFKFLVEIDNSVR